MVLAYKALLLFSAEAKRVKGRKPLEKNMILPGIKRQELKTKNE